MGVAVELVCDGAIVSDVRVSDAVDAGSVADGEGEGDGDRDVLLWTRLDEEASVVVVATSLEIDDDVAETSSEAELEEAKEAPSVVVAMLEDAAELALEGAAVAA